MVILLNLDDKKDDFRTFHSKHDGRAHFYKPQLHRFITRGEIPCTQANRDPHDRSNPNINGFSAALACYPSASPLDSLLFITNSIS